MKTEIKLPTTWQLIKKQWVAITFIVLVGYGYGLAVWLQDNHPELLRWLWTK